VDIVQLLLDQGAAIDAQDSEGTTALLVAARAGQREVVVELVRRGADRSIQQRVNRLDDPACAAARAGDLEVLRAVLGETARAVPSFHDGSIVSAASAEHDGIVAFLLDMGAPVTSPGPLCNAAMSGQTKIAQRLLSAGADPNGKVVLVPYHVSMLPLVNACFSGSLAMVALLLTAGADPNVRDERDDTPLLVLAEAMGDEETQIAIMKLLAAAGAELDAQGNYGQTAHCLAQRAGKPALTKALLAAGANSIFSTDE
jgi:ankyrin repeat protein